MPTLRKATFESNDFFDSDVEAIQSDLDSTLIAEQNVRGGLEFRIEDTWRFRWVGGWRSPAAAKPLRGLNGLEDGTLLEDGAAQIHWALGGEYRAETWYAGATYRHLHGRRAAPIRTQPGHRRGRTEAGCMMTSIGARY